MRRLKVKSDWHRQVKAEGLRRMEEFIDKERDAAESESVDTFENPLKIVLGKGLVQLEAVQSTDGICLVFGMHGERGEVGSQGESIIGYELKKNQVCVVCTTRASAEALQEAVRRVIALQDLAEKSKRVVDGIVSE
jgi:hypothetical protein